MILDALKVFFRTWIKNGLFRIWTWFGFLGFGREHLYRSYQQYKHTTQARRAQ